MAYSDDFAIIGVTADNFDCDSATGWTTTGGVTPIVTNTDNRGGTASIEMRSANTGVSSWEQDVGTIDADRFKISEESLNVWFRYSKGKGASYLGDGSTLEIRLYFGGTVDFADYRPLNNADEELLFGWNLLQISGTELNGGVPNFGIVAATAIVAGRDYIITTVGNTNWAAIGGPASAAIGDRFTATGAGTGTGQASDTTDVSWSDFIHRVQIRLNFQAANDKESEDAPLLMDSWFSGTKIIVSEGTPAAPVSLEDIETYSNDSTVNHNSSGAFPLGLVNIDEVLANVKCGLDIGNGSDGTNNEGNVSILSKFILFDQWSKEVEQNIVVKNFSSLDFGEVEAGTDGNYPVRGCQIVMPPDRPNDMIVENGGTLRLLNSKVFRWQDLFLGAASDTGSTIELRGLAIDSCRLVYLRSNTLDIADVEVYNNSGSAQCGEIIVSPDSCSNFLNHDNQQGFHFRANVTITEYLAQDNVGDDLAVLDGFEATLVDSFFDNTKIGRLTV